MVKTISILNSKGGTGKSTVATNLSRALQLDKEKVLLVDSDTQGTARDWRNINEDDSFLAVIGIDRPTLEKDIPKVSEGFDYIVIDGSAKLEEMSVSAIKASNLILIPIQPSAPDIWGSSDLIDLIKTRMSIDPNLKAYFLISRQITGTNLAKEISDVLKELGLPVLKTRISQRIAYAEAISRGLSVVDIDSKGEASKEIQNLSKEIRGLLNGKN